MSYLKNFSSKLLKQDKNSYPPKPILELSTTDSFSPLFLGTSISLFSCLSDLTICLGETYTTLFVLHLYTHPLTLSLGPRFWEWFTLFYCPSRHLLISKLPSTHYHRLPCWSLLKENNFLLLSKPSSLTLVPFVDEIEIRD